MSEHKITGIHAIGVEIPKGMSFKELMERILEEGEVELEKELDEESASRNPTSAIARHASQTRTRTRTKRTGCSTRSISGHVVDVASDVHDAAGSLERELFDLGENQLAFEASMILSQSLTLLRAIQRRRKEVAE